MTTTIIIRVCRNDNFINDWQPQLRQLDSEDVQKRFRGFSQWSSWTICSKRCITVRRRSVHTFERIALYWFWVGRIHTYTNIHAGDAAGKSYFFCMMFYSSSLFLLLSFANPKLNWLIKKILFYYVTVISVLSIYLG